MANTYITRTPSSAGNRRKFTISMWVKRVKLGVDQWLVQAGASGSEFDIRFTTSDTLRFSTWDGSNGYGMITTRVFRDTSAWYHLVFQYDTAQATDTNRNKIYINGEQINPSDTSAYNAGKHPPQNYDNPSWNNTTAFRINDVTWTSSSPKDAVYSHIHHTDGYAYDASTFGSTDSTTGEWKINTSPSVTYGTNGFFILKDGNTITDSSSNSNNFALAQGTLTKTEDCPDNNFATNNPICNVAGRWTITNGNNTIQHANGGSWTAMISSIAPSVGKYYMEAKITAGASRTMFGVMSADTNIMSYATNLDSICLYYNLSGGEFQQSGGTTSGNNYGTFADNDIAGIALDCTNKYISIYKNGSALVTNHTIPTTVTGPIGFGFTSDSNSTVYQCNYGNGYYGTTAVTTNSGNGYAGTDGKSIFSYQPPTGYSALSTRGLNL